MEAGEVWKVFRGAQCWLGAGAAVFMHRMLRISGALPCKVGVQPGCGGVGMKGKAHHLSSGDRAVPQLQGER